LVESASTRDAASLLDVMAIPDQGGAPTPLVTTAYEVGGWHAIVSDRTRAYWVDGSTDGAVASWGTGDAKPRTIAKHEPSPRAIALDAKRVYWTNSTGVWAHAK
jgi:hypothetical protein